MSEHRIILEFEDADELHQALEYIGDSDAPVFIAGGSVEFEGKTFSLWGDYEDVMAHLYRAVQ